jgi:single-strand DNA-binding protein
MFNKIIVLGNLTKDPDLRYTPRGTAVCNFRIASTTRYRSNGEAKEETLFIDTVVWGKQAEACGQYLQKGRPVLVEGRLQERRWESDGQQRSKMEIVADSVRFLGKSRDAGTGGTQAPPQETTDIEPF